MWSDIYNRFNQDRAFDIAVDESGFVYLTGESDGETGDEEIVTMKLDGVSGLPLWRMIFEGEEGGSVYSNAVVVDGAGNVFVAGGTTQLPIPSDYIDLLLVKYSAEGNLLWSRSLDGSRQQDDMAERVALDDAGNVYVAGTSTEHTSNLDLVILKYSNDGDLLWMRKFNGLGGSNERLVDLAVASNRNIFIVGSSKVQKCRDCRQ